MSDKTNPFSKSVVKYTDLRLLSIIESPNDFAPKLVDAAKTEAGIRNLKEIDTAAITHEEEHKHVTIVRQNLGFGTSIENCEIYLLNEGLSRKEALTILDKAVELGPLHKEIITQESNEEKGPSIWLILITMFAVVKLIMRLTS